MNTLDRETITSCLTALCQDLTDAGYSKRLMMTDDIKDVRKVRERAVAEKNAFFYGIALPERLQARLDALVRERKAELLDLIAQDVATHNIAVTFHQDQDAYLFTFLANNMGFYVNSRTTIARKTKTSVKPTKQVAEAAPRVTLNSLIQSLPAKVEKPKAQATPIKANKSTKKHPPVKRRQFTEIRVIKN